MPRPRSYLHLLTALLVFVLAPGVAAQSVATRPFQDLSDTDSAGNPSRSVRWPIDLAMGETVQLTTCAEVLAGAHNAGDTAIRLTTASRAPLDAADDGGCGDGGRGTSLVFTAGSAMQVIAWVGCARDTSCSGTAALRTDHDASGNAADLPGAIRRLGPLRHSRIYTHADGVNHPDAYAAPGSAHARFITRIPRRLVGEDFFVAYGGGDGGGTGIYLRHGFKAAADGETFHRTGSPLVHPLNTSRVQQPRLSTGARPGDRPGGGQRFGRYLVIAETDGRDAGDTGYRNAFYELLAPSGPGRVARRIRTLQREQRYSDVLYAAITKLQGFDSAKDTMFPRGHARSYLLANLRPADETGPDGGALAIDFWMLRPDRHGWFDPASFATPSAPWHTWQESELLPAGTRMEAARNGNLFTDREGRVWLVHYDRSASFGLGNPWFTADQDTVFLYRVYFHGQPISGGDACARAVCIEKSTTQARTMNGGEGDGGLSPGDSFVGAVSGYLAPPAGEDLFVYSSEHGDNGSDRFRVYEWAPPGRR